MSFRTLSSFVAAVLFTSAPAFAVPIAPGGGRSVPEEDTVPKPVPPGMKIAEKVLPFTVVFPAYRSEVYTSENTADGTLNSSVYLSPAGTLTFRYAITLEEIQLGGPEDTEVPLDEANLLTVGNFSGFLTDVTGDFGDVGVFNATRTANGSLISGNIGSPGQGEEPVLIIETNATAFDNLGSARFEPAAELLLRPGPGEDIEQVTRDGLAVIDGIYQPIIVPEPTGAVLLLSCTTGAILRHRRRA